MGKKKNKLKSINKKGSERCFKIDKNIFKEEKNISNNNDKEIFINSYEEILMDLLNNEETIQNILLNKNNPDIVVEKLLEQGNINKSLIFIFLGLKEEIEKLIEEGNK